MREGFWKIYSKGYLKAINRISFHIQKDPDLGSKFSKLDKTSLELKVNSGSPLANTKDKTSEIWFVILMVGKYENCNILSYSRKRCKRIMRSVLGGELHSFAEGFESAYFIKQDLETMCEAQIPLTMLTNSKSLLNVITKISTTSE